MENVILTLSWTGAILTILLYGISFLLSEERRAIHGIIVSSILILLKIVIIIALIVMKLNIIIKILMGIISVSFILMWGFVLFVSIINLRGLKNQNNDLN